ncbi:hypothetical protein C8F04DRAFT_1094235 [Mycena alexandri]|uniref:Transmembrane protein n=1 Tax=Mycena alexandri TaxID=1745969 RepID=A0AAD6SZL4_9AGAR|nr:hypothetical protein C8F04DRAFT_1094235 [Mycena alexandri]
MRFSLYFLLTGTFAVLSFVSGLRNVTLDDSDSAIVYSAGWNVSSGTNSLDFNGSLHFSDNSTASASFTFRGVAVYLMDPFWSSAAGAQVQIDGQGPFVIDLRDYVVATESGLRETQQSQVVWSATQLPDTNHTLVITMGAGMDFVVLDGLTYSVTDANNVESIAAPDPTASDVLTTITTTKTISPSSQASSSPLSSSSNLSSSPAEHFTNAPINAATAPSTSTSTVTASAAPAASALSTSAKRYLAIGGVLGAVVFISVVLVFLVCFRRRRRIQRRRRQESWSHKFMPRPYTAHAVYGESKPPSPQSSVPRSPIQSAVPLLSPATPGARRIPRSPLATTPPITASTPSPQTAQFPVPLAAHMGFAAPSSPAPATPLPLTPLPPATPGTPWSTQKSNRYSSSSTYSYESLESGLGYGWTTPSLVGIHPFSAPAEADPTASSSGSSAGARDTVPTAPLTPRLNEKSAAALFRNQQVEQRLSIAPAYREKDAARMFEERRARAHSGASQTAPPVYEP